MLEKTLTISDLTLFGITSILGSGGFNLIGNALASGGVYAPVTLGASGALFLGSAYSYSYARKKYNSNISESKIIESVFGNYGKNLSIFTILFYNIFAAATILVFCSKLLFPNVSYYKQISFSLLLLTSMALAAFNRLNINKNIINLFSVVIVGLLSIATYLGLKNISSLDINNIKFPQLNIYESFLFFFFILAGHDALIKFTEEAKNSSDIDKSMYYSIIISILLTAGTCLAFIYYLDFKNDSIDNALAVLFGKVFSNSGKYIIGFLSLLLMVVTTFLGFLATTRYLYSLTKSLEVLGTGEDSKNNVSPMSIAVVFILCALAILINHTNILVELSDISLIVTLLLVASSTFIDKYKNDNVSLIDLGTSIGFLYVLMYRWLRK